MALLIPVILGLIPSFVWLFFYLHEDYKRPEPRKLIFYTFLAGAFITIFVLQFQIWINNFVNDLGFGTYSGVAFIFFALTEEFFKFFAAFLIVNGRKELDEPIDAMIYMVVAALGFSAVENVASIFRSIETIESVGPLETVTLRFIGATLLHTLSSGVVGYYWGLAIAKRAKFWSAIWRALLIAAFLHAVFNFFIIKFEEITIPILFLVIFGYVILSDFEKLKKLER